MTNRCRDVIIRIAPEGTCAKAERVSGAVMQLHHLIKILNTVGNTRQAENRPCRIIRMAIHTHTGFLTHRDNSIEEIFEIFPQVIRTY